MVAFILPANHPLIYLFVAGVTIGIIPGLCRLFCNWLAGVILRARGLRPGDIIEFRDGCAWISKIGKLNIVIQTWDRCLHIVPYRGFVGGILHANSYVKRHFTIRIPVSAYNSLPEQRNPPPLAGIATQLNLVLKQSPVLGVVEGTDFQGVILRIYAWVSKDSQDGLAKVRSQVLLGIRDRLNASGMGLPIQIESAWRLN